VQALATDEEMAEQAAELPDDDRKASWQRQHRDYSAEVEMLTAVFDRLGELIRITAAVHGGRGKPPPPGPRPVYAIERIRRRHTKNRHDQLVGRLIKKKPVAE
jgi:hypothetical protein